MTNIEKFKTAKERERAFSMFCIDCEKCKLKKVRWESRGVANCAFHWLDLEAKEKKKND